MPDIMAVQRRLTEWFMRYGPSYEIVLIPTVEVKTPGKGIKREAGTPRDTQSFKKIWPGGDGYISTGVDGTQHKFDLIMVGVWDCLAEPGDTWVEDEGQKYIIHSEFPNNGYERKFGVLSFGGNPKDG